MKDHLAERLPLKLQVVLKEKWSLQYNAALLPGVNTTAQGMFCGAKYIHHTFMPIIKHH